MDLSHGNGLQEFMNVKCLEHLSGKKNSSFCLPEKDATPLRPLYQDFHLLPTRLGWAGSSSDSTQNTCNCLKEALQMAGLTCKVCQELMSPLP